jgi:GDSL-like Lipase/Acylhydrolase family
MKEDNEARLRAIWANNRRPLRPGDPPLRLIDLLPDDGDARAVDRPDGSRFATFRVAVLVNKRTGRKAVAVFGSLEPDGPCDVQVEGPPIRSAISAAELLDRAGLALFGDHYIAPMAALLKVDKNTVGKWRDGKSHVPTGVWRELVDPIDRRYFEVMKVRDQVRAEAPTEAVHPDLDPARLLIAPTPSLKPFKPPTSADVLMMGDSIAASWPLILLQSMFFGQRIDRIAISGERVEETRWKLDHCGDLHPKSVLLAIGTNNLGRNPPLAIASSILELIAEIRKRWQPLIYLFAIPPFGENGTKMRSERHELNQALRAGLQPGVILVEAEQALLRASGAFREDFLHLSSDGYAILTRALRKKRIDAWSAAAVRKLVANAAG